MNTLKPQLSRVRFIMIARALVAESLLQYSCKFPASGQGERATYTWSASAFSKFRLLQLEQICKTIAQA